MAKKDEISSTEKLLDLKLTSTFIHDVFYMISAYYKIWNDMQP